MTRQYLVERDFVKWDDKITTPPGIYVIGMIFGDMLKMCGISDFIKDEETFKLRYLNR